MVKNTTGLGRDLLREEAASLARLRAQFCGFVTPLGFRGIADRTRVAVRASGGGGLLPPGDLCRLRRV